MEGGANWCFAAKPSVPFTCLQVRGSLGRSQVSELIACLPVCSQSVSSAAMLARKAVQLHENLFCVYVYVRACVFPASARYAIVQAAPRQDPSASHSRGTGQRNSGTGWHKHSSP